jgi:S-adenosylmethionine synthetase
MIYKTSEWVSLGHPDKVADYISEYILDRIIEQDPNARYAVEVQIKGDNVTLGGEVTTTARVKWEEWTKEAVAEIGYTKAYQNRFGSENTICANDIHTHVFVTTQSPDIAQGVDTDAWGDQGIFMGFYCDETGSGQGLDYATARAIGKLLYEAALQSKILGIDIKTQVTVEFDRSMQESKIDKIIVAIPMVKGKEKEGLKEVNRLLTSYKSIGTKVIINGTGSYCQHGPIADCGTTGRKLAVDFYGGRSRVGGGSPWTKDSTKADLSLNLFAFNLAGVAFKQFKKQTMDQIHHVEAELSCCIGKKDVLLQLTLFDGQGNIIDRQNIENRVLPSQLRKKYMLDRPIYTTLCREGLFSVVEDCIEEETSGD